MRVRENAESIAFYGGEDNERRLLNSRLQGAVDNFLGALFYIALGGMQCAAWLLNLWLHGPVDNFLGVSL